MRWYVEIAPVGKGLPVQTLCLEATHWQPALQRARKLRGEDEKLSGLSVEFLSDGCRAIDGVLRLLYVVKKAPEDAPLMEDASVVAPAAVSDPQPSKKKKKKRRGEGLRERVLAAKASSPAAAIPAGPASDPLLRRKRDTQDFVSPGEVRESQDPLPPGQIAPPDPEAPPVPPSSKKAAPEKVRHKIVVDEHRGATNDVPVIYCERAIALEGPIEIADIAGFLRDQLDDLKLAHPSDGSMRLMHLALFDHAFSEDPQRPPVATLEWREWRSSEVDPIYFPYSHEPARTVSEATRLHGKSRIEPGQPLPKLSTRGSDASADPISRPVKVVPVVEVGEEKPKKTVATTASTLPFPEAHAFAPVTKAEAKPVEAKPIAKPVEAKPIAKPVEAKPEVKPKPTDTLPIDSKPSAPKPVESKPVESKPVESKPAKPIESKPPAPKESDPSSMIDPSADRRSSRRPIAGRSKINKTLASATPADLARAVDKPKDEARRSSSAPASSQRMRRSTVKLGSGDVQDLIQQAAAMMPEEIEAVSSEERERRLSEARERVSNIPPPASVRGTRSGGDQLIADLFEAVSQLQYISDALDGAHFVLSLALEKLPSEVGLVSWFDIDKREFVVVHQTGGDRSALLTRIAERSELQRRAMRSHSAVVVGDARKNKSEVDERWKIIGIEPRSLICAPVELGGRYLGLIELANPYDGKAFSESDGHALTYIGERYAEFLNQRGVIIDPEKVVAQAQRP